MSKSVTQRKPKRRCDTCFKINPPDANRCLNCKRVFVNPSIPHPIINSEINSEVLPGDSDSFFNEADIDLLLTLGNLTDINNEKPTKPTTATKTINSEKSDVWGNRKLPTTRVPLVIHSEKRLQSKIKHLQLIIGLIITLFVILLCLYLLS